MLLHLLRHLHRSQHHHRVPVYKKMFIKNYFKRNFTALNLKKPLFYGTIFTTTFVKVLNGLQILGKK